MICECDKCEAIRREEQGEAADEVDGLRDALAAAESRIAVEASRADVAEARLTDIANAAASVVRRCSVDGMVERDEECIAMLRDALSSTADIAGRWVRPDDVDALSAVDRAMRNAAEKERDAAIARAERAEAISIEAGRLAGLDGALTLSAWRERCEQAERARDEVGIQLVAAQAEIARLHKGLRDVEGFMLREWRPPAEAVLAMVRDVAAGGPSVPGDALATGGG